MNNIENRTEEKLGAPTDGPNSDLDQGEQAATLYKGQNAPIDLDSEIQKMAESIANDPTLIKNRIDTVNKLGVVGERKAIAMNFAALDSRLLLEDGSGSNALAIKIAGHYGAGKSHTLTKCLELYPQSEYHIMSAGSAKSLYYLDGGLKHKALIATEAFQFQSKAGSDSEIAYIVRSLLSEGSVRYQVTEKIKGEGRRTVEKRLDGPTSFITTTIMDKLERQLEDRLFTVHPDESSDQTMDIIAMTAMLKDGSFKGVDSKLKQAWQLFHESLEPVEVVIPFASEIADHIRRGQKPQISMRRAFKRVLLIIQTVACANQHQRERDDEDRVVAKISDYWMALQIVREAFRENLTNKIDETERRLDYIVKQGLVQSKSLATEWNISKGAVSGWVKSLVEKGILIWCDKDVDIRNQVKSAGLPFMFKHWPGKTANSTPALLEGKIWAEYPESLLVNMSW